MTGLSLSMHRSLPVQVKGVMIDNIDKVTQRGEKLEDINERAGMSTTHAQTHCSAHCSCIETHYRTLVCM